MQLKQVLVFYSCMNKLHFLLLCEVTLLGNWLQTFREKVGVLFSKGRDHEEDFVL